MSASKLTKLSLFIGIALILYYVESLLPPFFPIPGAKLGLANIVTLLLMEFYPAKDAFLVLLIRILIVSLLFGQALSFLFSIVGGLISILIIVIIKRILDHNSQILLGCFGGLFHNLGQFIVALFIVKSPAVLLMLPQLVILGVVTGFGTGLISSFLLPYLRPFFNKNS